MTAMLAGLLSSSAVASAVWAVGDLDVTTRRLGVGRASTTLGSRVREFRPRRRRRARALAESESQLSEGVAAIAAGLRAGMSLSQAVRFAASEIQPPLSEALAAVGDREAMGVPLDQALDDWTSEMGSPDARLTASVLQLHRRTGGDLPMVLDRLAFTLAQRTAAARETRSLTAQARLSGAILGFLPIGFFLFLSVMSPGDMAEAYRSPAGVAAIVGGLALQGIAFLWIRALLKVEP